MNHMNDHATVLHDYFKSGHLQKLPKNTPILAISDKKEAIYCVKSGYVRIYSLNRRGEQYTHIIYGAHEVFPLTWLAKLLRTNVAYETMTEAEVYCVPLDEFTKDLKTNNALSYAMLQRTIEQYRIYTMRVDNLEYKYASERLAYCLILLANRFGEHNGKTVTILPPLTHYLLGTSLNLSRESVSREMEKLIRSGLVHYGAARQIVINDLHQLAEQYRVPIHQGLPTAPEFKTV